MINERANNPKFLNKQIYKKNNKIHGQTLRITKKSIPKNTQPNTYNKNLQEFPNIPNPQNLVTNFGQNSILGQKKYLKKSLNKIRPNCVKSNKIISSFNIKTEGKTYNFSKSNIHTNNNIPNISLINNSLILNYMNKINNTISLNNNNISVNTNNIRSSMTSLENSNTNEISSVDNSYAPNNPNVKINKESNNKEQKLKSGKINIDLKSNKYNFKVKLGRNNNNKIINPFSIEKLVDNFIEKKLEKENVEKKNIEVINDLNNKNENETDKNDNINENKEFDNLNINISNNDSK
jgi:hypothetical protein